MWIQHIGVKWLTVGIQEGERFARGHGGPEEPRSDQAFSFSLTDHADDVQLFQILVQFVL